MKKNLTTQFSTRQYMLAKDFEIYYYSDTDLKSVASHWHSYYEIYFFLEGDVDMHIDGLKYELHYGDVIVIPPGTPHYARIATGSIPYRRFVFWLSTDYVDALTALSDTYIYLLDLAASTGSYIYHFDEYTFLSLQSDVFRLIEEVSTDRFGRDAAVSLGINTLMLNLSRSVYEQTHVKKPKPDEELYGYILRYIDSHIDEDLSLDRLAERFFVSKFYISHLFKDKVGLSTHQYIKKKRLAKCKDAILNGIGINDAYVMYGFTDYSAFYRAFHKEYGKSPKKYRDDILRKATWL